MLAACCLTASAGSFVVDGINYNVTDSVARHVEVIANNYAYNVTIPATVKCDTTTYTVTAIGQKAFYETNNLFQVTLPETIEAIEGDAFNGSSLTKINFPSSLRRIENGAFNYCRNLTEAILPDSLEYLGIQAYASSGLISVSIPKNIKNINDLTFSHCSALSTVVLHEDIFSIGKGAFGECRNLHNLIMPSAIKNVIGFSNDNSCKSLIASILRK